MAGSAIQLELDEGDLAAALGRLTGPLLDVALRDIAEYGSNRIDDHFQEERGPDGPWEPLKERTLKRKQRRNKLLKILREEDDLRRSIIYQIDDGGIVWGTNRVQAASMQFGDESRGIPARPFLYFTDEELQEMGELVRDRLTNRF